ncbi:hypothetical protein HanIR_Chr14g0671271 [Helianthus annuus]|nr:hypothetical protein HanIR_Chr14g0671271 [Helianthus annuus]
MTIEKVISTCTKFIYMEFYNMILSGIIRVNRPSIGWVLLNPIPVPVRDFFSFFSPYVAHTHWASGIPGPYVSGFGYTRRAWAFFPSLYSLANSLSNSNILLVVYPKPHIPAAIVDYLN